MTSPSERFQVIQQPWLAASCGKTCVVPTRGRYSVMTKAPSTRSVASVAKASLGSISGLCLGETGLGRDDRHWRQSLGLEG